MTSETRAPSFEEQMQRLTEIVKALEKGDLPLEQSLALFEEGVQLAGLAQKRLDSAEKKVMQLLGLDENGRARLQPFETKG